MFSFSAYSASFFKKLFDIKDGQFNKCGEVAVSELSMDRYSLDCLVLERIKNIIRYANENSQHYKNIFHEWSVSSLDFKTLDDLKKFPFLTRNHLKNNLELVTSFGNRKGWVKSSTGGTTSSPISYYRDCYSTSRRLVDTSVMDSWCGRVLGDRVAYLWGAQQDFSIKPSFGMRLRNLTYLRTIMLPSAPLDDLIMEQYLKKLNYWKPSFMQAYPTPLYEFCMFLKRSGQRLSYLKSASVTAEPLYEYQREGIEEILGFKVFNWYGSRELGRIATECECHDGLHINEPSVYVEILSDPALPSGFGHLVITDLWNRATPFIRYKTGDIARVIENDCRCGRVLKRIASIEGRLVDTIVMPGGRKVPGVSLTNRLVKDCIEIAELQVVQRTLDTFLVRYVRGSGFSTNSLSLVSTNLNKLLDSIVNVSFEEVNELPRSASGKVRFVINEMNDFEK